MCLNAALVSAFVVGAAIRLWQYALNPSLWMDEAFLALNIAERGVAQLGQPLSYNQAAPVGFLLTGNRVFGLARKARSASDGGPVVAVASQPRWPPRAGFPRLSTSRLVYLRVLDA